MNTVLKDWDMLNIIEEIKVIQRNNDFVVADIETTGFTPESGAEIIQIAAAKVVNGEIVDRFATFVKPTNKIPYHITKLTGITNKDVQFAPLIQDALKKFVSFSEDYAFVFHNAQFDWNTFLSKFLEESGYDTKRDVICTYQTFRKAIPGLGKGAYTNETMAGLFGFVLEDAHQADNDVEATAQSIMGLKRELDVLDVIALEKQKEEEEAKVSELNVKSVKYWGKELEEITLERQYVQLESKELGKGSVFYDITQDRWRNQSFKGRLSFEKVEKLVLEFLKLASRDDLKTYRHA